MSENQNRLSIYILLGMVLALLVGIGVGYLMGQTQIDSFRIQISSLEDQVRQLTSEKLQLTSSINELNRTLQGLLLAIQNKTAEDEGLVLRLDMKEHVRRNETMQVNATLVNFGDQPVVLKFPTSKLFDLKVVDSSGRIVYTWSQDKVFLTVIAQVELGPGESKKATMNWQCNLQQGKYVLIGLVESYNLTLTCSMPLIVEG